MLSLVFGNAFGVGVNGVQGVPNIETASVAIDSSGNRYIAGSYKGTADFGGNGPSSTSTSNGNSDGFVAKYTNAGLLSWIKPFGGSLNDRAAGVAVDANGNAYVTGLFQGTVTFDTGQTLTSSSTGSQPSAFFWGLDTNGNTKFLAKADTTGTSVQPQSIAVDPSGSNFAVGGFFTGALTLGSKTLTSTGTRDAFITKFNVSGTTLTNTWASQLAADPGATIEVNSLTMDTSGNVVVSGDFQRAVDFDPSPAISKVSTFNSTVDLFIEKFASATGNRVFSYTAGGPGQDVGGGVTTDSSGNILATGSFQNSVAFPNNGSTVTLTSPAGFSSYYLLKLSPTGVPALINELNGSTSGTNTGTPSIATNASGVIMIATTYSASSGTAPAPPTGAGGSDVLVQSYDSAGNLLFQTRAGGTGDDTATGVAISPSGSIAVVGTYAGPATFGSATLPNKYSGSTGSNIFLAAVAPQNIVVPGDFIGNQTTQASVFRPTTADWYVQGPGPLLPFGIPGQDLPVPGDYDGIGHSQQATYHMADATWYARNAAGSLEYLGQFGWAGHDIPVPGDYDGIGRTELAVYRPSTAEWFVLSPGGSRKLTTFGWPLHDIPAPADYTGSGITQPAVYRPTTAEWYVQGQPGVFATFGWIGHDIPVPGDYGKIGKSVPAVYRPDDGTWYVFGQPGVFTSFGWATPPGLRPMHDIPTGARLGTLQGLPRFNGDGSISSFGKPSGGVHGLGLASSPSPKTTVKVAITPISAQPAPSFVKAPAKRPAQGHTPRGRG